MSNEKEKNPLQEEVLKPFKQFFEFRKFWKTKKAILSGIPLYDWTHNEREKGGYLGHWSFNMQENAFSALPAVVVTNVLDYIFDKYKNDPPNLGSLDERTKIFTETVQSTSQFFFAFLTPVILTLLVFIAAWGSLKSSDSISNKRARARRAYLYFDGAYGLYLQALVSLLISLTIWFSDHVKLIERIPDSVLVTGIIIGYILFMIVAIIEFVQVSRTIPRQLFKVNGYSFRVRYFWQRKHPDDPPWNKYSFALFIGSLPVLIIVWIGLYFLSYITATIFTSVKMIFI